MKKIPRACDEFDLKRRKKFSHIIRLITFLSVTSIYFLLYLFSESKIVSSVQFSSKKLLSIKQEILFDLENTVNEVSEFQEIFPTIESKHINRTANTTNINKTNGIFLESIEEENCVPPAINDFPNDGFTKTQRQNGGIVIHILLVCYCFWILAAVCDDCFIPAIELICTNWQISRDVIGASVMAMATSSAELFINCVGTFVTEGDLGIGTIVGSAVFNLLAVPACCGLISCQVVKLNWWPITRDSVMYLVAIFELLIIIYDGKVMWYEALTLVLSYIIYLLVLYSNEAIATKAKQLITFCRRSGQFEVRPYREVTEITPLLTGGMTKPNILTMEPVLNAHDHLQFSNNSSVDYDRTNAKTEEIVPNDSANDPWTRNSNHNSLFIFIIRWPITFVLWLTIPDCRKFPKLRFLTLIMSIFWIGSVSYLVAFLITVVGDTFSIPDSVMGITILAVGMSIPEAVSSVIVTNQGHGAMGICNSIGSNTFDILLCLGLPWFIKSYFLPNIPNENWVNVQSNGLQYSVILLFITMFGLYLAFVLNKFCINWKIGFICSLMYVGFLIFASMIELNYFIDVNLPVCSN